MDRRQTHSHFGLCAVAWLVGFVSFANGNTPLAATAPAIIVPQLIKQLGSDNPADRDAAQSQLEQMGDQAAEPLSIAARDDSDPEIRNRAAAVLVSLKERDTLLASLVTVHATDQPLKEVLATIGSSAHCQVIDGASLMRSQAGRSRTVTLDAVDQPFWETIGELCARLNYCPDFGSAGMKSLRLFPTSRNWMTQSPHDLVGPYLVTAVGIYRTRSIDLLGPASISDQLSLRLNLFPEPKMSVLDMSDFRVTKAIDDLGDSLAPAPVDQSQSMPRPHDSRDVDFMANAKLNYPAHVGTRISLLSGEITAIVGVDFEHCQVDDMISVPAVSRPLGLGHAIVMVTQMPGAVIYKVVVRFSRSDLNNDQWFTIENNTIDLTLEDAEGQSLPGRVEKAVIQHAVNPADASGTITAQFFTGNPAHPSGIHTGKPTRLKLNIPESIRTITIPVTMKDIPIP